ncbi:unnamed protein product [Cuscuta europaea]|uniref:Uncharacterized protein n=1 Tax=Cuscuta europaea TaxID=41803 RepID=A0A9P0ZP23_CUSEU|nr:unnamed protein product [Cuscuta europaea]
MTRVAAPTSTSVYNKYIKYLQNKKSKDGSSISIRTLNSNRPQDPAKSKEITFSHSLILPRCPLRFSTQLPTFFLIFLKSHKLTLIFALFLLKLPFVGFQLNKLSFFF